MKVFYGKTAHIVAAILGLGLSACAVYWLGRSDEVQQILDMLEDDGNVSVSFHNRRNGNNTSIHITKE